MDITVGQAFWGTLLAVLAVFALFALAVCLPAIPWIFRRKG